MKNKLYKRAIFNNNSSNEFKNSIQSLLEGINIDLILEKRNKKDKLKNFIDEFVYDESDKSVYFKSIPEVKLHKNSIGKLVNGVNALKNSSTSAIHDNIVNMNNYDPNSNTIDINGHTFKVMDILHFERALIHFL
jgi:hypothetical protein